jgi:hypothetical protein
MKTLTTETMKTLTPEEMQQLSGDQMTSQFGPGSIARMATPRPSGHAPTGP